MKGINEAISIRRKGVHCEVESNDSTLSTVLNQLGYIVNPGRFDVVDFGRVELKYFLVKSTSNFHSYVVGFLFDATASGKLFRIQQDDLARVVSNIRFQLKGAYTLILVGKKGSRKDNRFTFKCVPSGGENVVIREFTSQDNIQAFISAILSDIDKIECRYDIIFTCDEVALQARTGPNQS